MNFPAKKLHQFRYLTKTGALTTGLVKGGNESRIIIEGSQHKSVVLLVDLEDGAHVDLRIVESVIAKLLNGRQTLDCDVVLQKVPQLPETVRNTRNELKRTK